MKKLLFLFLIAAAMQGYGQSTYIKDVTLQTEMFEVNGKLMFAGIDSVPVGVYLYISDGTPEGTHQLDKTIEMLGEAASIGYNLYEPIVYNNALYFVGDSVSTSSHTGVASTFGLWKSDGTDAGTVLLRAFGGGMFGQYHADLPSFCVANNLLFFAANDGVHGAELWKTDGTVAGTTLVKDLNSSLSAGSEPDFMTAYKNEVYFVANGDTTGKEVYKSDGTDAGTVLLKDIIPGPIFGINQNPAFTISGGYLYFNGSYRTGTNYGSTYRTDGATAGTIVIDTVYKTYGSTGGFGPYQADVNGTFMYIAQKPSAQNKAVIIKSDGTMAGTTEVVPADTTLIPQFYQFFTWNDKLYYSGQTKVGNTVTQSGLAVSDGTTQGTKMVTSFAFGNGSQPYQLQYANAGSSFFFQSEMLVSQLLFAWRMVQSDGTNSYVFHGACSANRAYTNYYNGSIYFQGADTATSVVSGLYKITPLTELPTGVENITTLNEINVFPNPADQTLTIRNSSLTQQETTMSIYNLVGEKLHSFVLPINGTTTLNIANWASGLYFCTAQQNGTAQTTKIIVQH